MSNQGIGFSEISSGNESHARGFHCGIVLEHHTRFQWPVGRDNEVRTDSSEPLSYRTKSSD